MSGYINFYVVPKKTRKRYGYDPEKGNTEEEIEISTGVPLLLLSYSRNNEIYRQYNDVLNPPYAGDNETYQDVTHEEALSIVREYENDMKSTQERLEIEYKMLEKCNNKEVFDTLWDDIMSMEKYYKEQQETLGELKRMADLIYELSNCTDFEKVVVNID